MGKGNGVYIELSGICDFERGLGRMTGICEKGGIDMERGKIGVVGGMDLLMGGV